MDNPPRRIHFRFIDVARNHDTLQFALELQKYDVLDMAWDKFTHVTTGLFLYKHLDLIDMWISAHAGHKDHISHIFDEAALAGADYCIDSFLEHNIDINGTNNRGETALFTAIMNRNFPFVERLMELGANIDILPPNAIEYQRQTIEKVKREFSEMNFGIERER